MAVYGVQTWDANGRPNNTGLVPVFILGYVYLGENQEGSWGYSVPSGFVLDYMMVPNPGGLSQNGRRSINVSGGTITAVNNNGSDLSPNTFPRSPYTIIAFIRKS